MKAERRSLIVQAARGVFYEAGFEAAPTAEIAARAGVAAGTIFSYFPTKELMLLAVVAEDLVDRHAEVKSATTESLFDGLLAFYRRSASFLAERPSIARMFVRIAASSSRAEITQATGSAVDAMDAASVELIEQAIGNGALPSGLNASHLAANCRAIFLDVLNREDGWADIDRLLDEQFAPRLQLQIAPLLA